MKNWSNIFERLIWKVTSGRFIFTVVVAGVYAYLAINGILSEDRIMEITLVVLYAYFNIPRPNGSQDTNGNGNSEDTNHDSEKEGKKDV